MVSEPDPDGDVKFLQTESAKEDHDANMEEMRDS
jgi:hypothetical protein